MKLNELLEKYNLELDKIVETIKEKKAKNVLIQLPDGLKRYATEIVNYLEQRVSCEFKIFLGDCFGACDVPDSDADLIVQFGHAEWK